MELVTLAEVREVGHIDGDIGSPVGLNMLLGGVRQGANGKYTLTTIHAEQTNALGSRRFTA